MKLDNCSRRGARLLLGGLLLSLLAASAVFSQDIATKGAISGKVTDATGAAIVGAKVTITGSTSPRTATANAEGDFEVQNLVPGLYTVKAEQSGFKTVSVPDVLVNVGKTSALKLTLQPGNITEVV